MRGNKQDKGASSHENGSKPKKRKAPKALAAKKLPYKFNQERATKLIQAIMVGLSIERACLHAGISKFAYYSWVKRGEDDRVHLRRTELADFKEAIDAALVAAEVVAASRVVNDAQSDWQAASWLLRFRYGWGAAQKLEVSGPNGGPLKTEAENVNVNVDLRDKTTEKLGSRLSELLAVARRRRGEPDESETEPDADESED